MRVRILYLAMRRTLAIVIFATAAAGATAAGAGVLVAPHIDPPGTPLFHAHAMAAYRLPIFLGVLRAKWDPKQGLASSTTAFDLATIALALLALLWPRLPRPTVRAIAEMPAPRVSRALWRSPLLLGPPKPALP
jgi:hypothetical protein